MSVQKLNEVMQVYKKVSRKKPFENVHAISKVLELVNYFMTKKAECYSGLTRMSRMYTILIVNCYKFLVYK